MFFTTFLLAAGFEACLESHERKKGLTPWTIDVVDFRTVSQSDLQDVALSSLSRRLASRQTVRAVVTISVHLDFRRVDTAIARPHGTASRTSTRGCVCSRLFDSMTRANA